jgi:mannose-6-phosphate isomerase-like protein (cupin superfamily)
MATVGNTIVNPATGEEITWRRIEPEALEWEDVWTRPGHRAAPHAHPGMEERWRVLEGQAAFRIGDDEERRLGPGDEIAAPPGVGHSAWNPTDAPVRLHVTMTPALRWAEVVEKLFAWARDGHTDAAGTPERELLIELLRDYAAELAPPS